MPKKTKILIASSTKARAQLLTKHLKQFQKKIDCVVANDLPKSFDRYKLLICDLGPRLKSPRALLGGLRDDAHVIVIAPDLDVNTVSDYMLDPRVNHFLSRDQKVTELVSVVDKLATGSIFGLERYLPQAANLHYRRLGSYKRRCEILEELDEFLRSKRLRGRLRRSGSQVAEELMMNAMYQAPIDLDGKRIFRDISPRQRIRRRTPRPISIRYEVHKGSFFLSVRDRFGSFKRSDLASYLFRCVNEDVQIEEKKLGAGLGLFLVASQCSRFIINILPYSVAEFICVLEPSPPSEKPLKMLSVSTQMQWDTITN